MLTLKLKKNSSLRKNSLYDLEKIFGECNGHGCGFGREDINWDITKTQTLFIIKENNDEITIKYIEYSDKEPLRDIGTGHLPQEWIDKIQKMMGQHCVKVTGFGLVKYCNDPRHETPCKLPCRACEEECNLKEF